MDNSRHTPKHIVVFSKFIDDYTVIAMAFTNFRNFSMRLPAGFRHAFPLTRMYAALLSFPAGGTEVETTAPSSGHQEVARTGQAEYIFIDPTHR